MSVQPLLAAVGADRPAIPPTQRFAVGKFSDNFAVFAAADGGIERIRELALHLAFRGLLTGTPRMVPAVVRGHHEPLVVSKGHHDFWMTPNAVLNHWCPECGRGVGRSRPTLSLEDLEETAAKRGGRCLSDEYRGVRAYYEWECAARHRWEATGMVVRGGHWCRECAHRIVGTIDGMRAHAVSLGGECLSTEYTGSRTMLLFICHARHRFELMAAAVKTGVWCPRCPAQRAQTTRKKLRSKPCRAQVNRSTHTNKCR